MRPLYEVIEEYDPDKNYQIHITPTVAKYLTLLKKGQKIEPRKFIQDNIEGATVKASAKLAERMIYTGFRNWKEIGFVKKYRD